MKIAESVRTLRAHAQSYISELIAFVCITVNLWWLQIIGQNQQTNNNKITYIFHSNTMTTWFRKTI